MVYFLFASRNVPQPNDSGGVPGKKPSVEPSDAMKLSMGKKENKLMNAQQGIQADCPEDGMFCSTCTGVVILASSRPSLLEQSLNSLLQLRGIDKYQVFISQDGEDNAVTEVAQRFAKKHDFVRHVHNDMHDDKKDALHKIADHYKFVFTLLFERELGVNHAILIEEDMLLSPDFLTFFETTAPILDEDPTLFAISSWNDNGYLQMDLDPSKLLRTRWFPGLGWMLRRELWVKELKNKWPAYNWDHWMRVDAQLQGRDCIVPELSRNHNIGTVGTNSNPEVHARLLGNVSYASAATAVKTFGDVTYLDRRRYFMDLKGKMQSAIPYSLDMGFGEPSADFTYQFGYLREDFMKLSAHFGLYPSDWPRVQFDHCTVFRRNGNAFLLYDRRQSTLAPPDTKVDPPDDLQNVAGKAGQDCNAACQAKGQKCDEASFDFINSCEYLAQSFECKGCGFKASEALPGFYAASGECIITDMFPKCASAGKEISRLCPCV